MTDVLGRLKSALAERYEFDREVGRGGMATVFLATDRKHDRKVALKVLHPELGASVGHERFLREIRIVAGLTHPRILTLIDSGEADGLRDDPRFRDLVARMKRDVAGMRERIAPG